MKVNKIDCPSCGAKISPKNNYCEYCGSAIHIDYENQKANSTKFTNKQTPKLSRTEIKSQIIILSVFMAIWVIGAITIGVDVILSQPSFDFTQIIPFLMAAAGVVFLTVSINNLVKKNKVDEEKSDPENKDNQTN